MNIKVYEGENLEELINKAKEELGEDIKVLYYEESFEKSWWLPFKKRKKFRLFVEKNEEQPKQPEIDFNEIFKKVESLIDEKLSKAIVQLPIEEKEDKVDLDEFKEFTGEALDLIKLLVDKGVSPEVAKEIVEPACGLDLETNKMDLNTSTYKEALIKGITEKIKFVGDLDFSKSDKFKVIAFVGPTGVGKTTNLFKLAAKMLEKNLKIGVISTDTFKVGAIQQARFYANILNVPFYATSDSKLLRKTLLELADMDAVLVDTVGRSHYDSWKLGEIKEILKGSMDWLVPYLTISCNYSTQEALNVVAKYKIYFPISAIFFTKIDETSKPGILLNIPVKTGLPVSYISTGQKVPEDIKVLTPEVMASFILGEETV